MRYVIAVAAMASLLLSGPRSASATPPLPYQGVYVILDPYNTTDMNNLSAAAAVSCTAQTSVQTPFCTPAGKQYISVVYLRMRWCSWQLSNATLKLTTGQTCYYGVNGSTGTGTDKLINSIPVVENISTCNMTSQVYDLCSASLFTAALGNIETINTNRGKVGLGPLQISIAIDAGPSAPIPLVQSSLVTIYDMPASISTSYCLRYPNIWGVNFLNAYEAAIDKLISTLQTFDSGKLAGTLTLVKVSPGNTNSDELDMNGRYFTVASAGDDLTLKSASESAIACPTSSTPATNAAQLLLDGYNSQIESGVTYPANYPDCRGYARMSDATECVFGSAMGHIRGTLDKAGLTAVLEAVPTNNGDSMPDVNCGTLTTPTSCAVQASRPPHDQWSIYYPYSYIYDLFQATTTSVAYQAANWAYGKVISGATLGGSGFNKLVTVTWTALQEPASGPGYDYFSAGQNTMNATSIQQIACALNNQIAADQPTLTLNGAPYGEPTGQMPGVPGGTTLSCQTMTMQGTTCNTPYGRMGNTDYYGVWNSAYLNGGMYLEVQTDVAFPQSSFFPSGNLAKCAVDLGEAVSQFMAHSSPPSICMYN